jgi:RNA polymerase sigma factor (sigma-70 family)
LTLSPVRLRQRQLDGAERLVGMIDPDKHYPYDLVCYRITGFRKPKASTSASLRGADLLNDLSQLVDDLSKTAPQPANRTKTRLLTAPELAEELNVSTKTILRWRARGLMGRRYLFEDGKVALAFTSEAVKRFVDAHQDLVTRAAAFRQLTDGERADIVRGARQLLAERRMKLHEVARELSVVTGRAVETIRYTLRQHDQDNPDEAVFARDETPQVPGEYKGIYQAYLEGEAPRAIARRFKRTIKAVKDIIREMRCRRILEANLECQYSPEFDDPNAEDTILGEDAVDAIEYIRRGESDALAVQPYLNDLARLPVLTREQEMKLFRQYNYLKFRAHELADGLDPTTASPKLIDRIEGLIERAEEAKNAIIRCNLRLVISIAKRHVGKRPNLVEIASDGNIALMRAVEKFDYTRGNKFSTYATWAIMRNYARTIPEERYRAREYQTAADEMLESMPDTRPVDETAWERRGLKKRIGEALAQLDDREQRVLSSHFGLTRDGQTETLEQIGKRIGVTKERVRQIEKRALVRLRELLPCSILDLVPE